MTATLTKPYRSTIRPPPFGSTEGWGTHCPSRLDARMSRKDGFMRRNYGAAFVVMLLLFVVAQTTPMSISLMPRDALVSIPLPDHPPTRIV